ncbi:hypothetical protein Hypma_005759 [Hypsizygus marmoreus]|uniref:54S ribosomal protein L27, mitochondrial n=1 Tax=Hypsizygus marmoreus TaxID=39966 RepID=A0A369KD37_HYPMA|nr:hypothetical protein Hypma_005759 [Hypsizygus marmoreus]
MFATIVRLSKASRKPLTTKRGNKDYYKGTRQAFLPGGHRTGAPGKHVIGGKAKYRLLDEKVRVFVAPPLEQIQASPLKPYVSVGVRLTRSEERAVFGTFPGPRGLTPEYFLKVARKHTGEALKAQPVAEKKSLLSWPLSSTEDSAQKEVAVTSEPPSEPPSEKTVVEPVRS